jgi:predicted tellurium resistance membrane protein TerC
MTPDPLVQMTLSHAILAVALSDITLAFDNALANSQMAAGLPRRQQKKALIFGMLLSCLTMVILTFLVVQIRTYFDWVRYPAGLWLLYVVFKLWFEKESEPEEHQVARAMMKAILLIAFTDLTMAADNAIANSEFALRVTKEQVWFVLIFGLLISCTFMIISTYTIVRVRRFADWIRYPAGLWLLYVAYLILTGGRHH